jgi:hypothetical protein
MGSAFKNTLTEVMENLVQIDYQTNKYATTNAIKKKMIQSDVRQKIKALQYNLCFLDRMIDSIFVNHIVIKSAIVQSNQQLPLKDDASMSFEEERKSLAPSQ